MCVRKLQRAAKLGKMSAKHMLKYSERKSEFMRKLAVLSAKEAAEYSARLEREVAAVKGSER